MSSFAGPDLDECIALFSPIDERRCVPWENLEMETESVLAVFTILGTGGKAATMKVPYAKKWQKETDKLRKIAVDCDLTEALKWGKPCFTFQKKNVAIVIPLKESCAYEAIALEESGKKVELKNPSEYPIPEELQSRLDDNAVLRAAFGALSPGRRKSYIFHVSSAKQAKTRSARVEKCVPMILSGRGFNELPS
jgi:uncharacterized protein YdeI (YjbR/CyaY-like superfamily)